MSELELHLVPKELYYHEVAYVRGLEAQIAAKDVALTRIVNECSRFPIKDGLAFRVESIALNGLNSPVTPAQETG
jgi:hypothetical protein